jgi:hypothetical protein
MRIEDAIACLHSAGYKITKPRPRPIASDGRPPTKQWPPAKGEQYIGVWPPSFKSHSVYRPRPLRPGGAPLPKDWAERTATIVRFMSQEARANG